MIIILSNIVALLIIGQVFLVIFVIHTRKKFKTHSTKVHNRIYNEFKILKCNHSLYIDNVVNKKNGDEMYICIYFKCRNCDIEYTLRPIDLMPHSKEWNLYIKNYLNVKKN